MWGPVNLADPMVKVTILLMTTEELGVWGQGGGKLSIYRFVLNAAEILNSLFKSSAEME